MRTARSSSRPGEGGLHYTPPGPGTPLRADPPGTSPPPQDQAPPPPPPGPVDRITDACENITLPQLRCGR